MQNIKLHWMINSAYHQQAELQKEQKVQEEALKRILNLLECSQFAVKSVKDFTIPFDFM